MKYWHLVGKGDRAAVALADRHYNRRKVGSPQFMPPGETVVLVAPDAVWGWWRPHPRSGLASMNGLDGWTCTIFRNEGPALSSDMILDAELALADKDIGPDGLLTYVWDAKVRSTNPGYCFKMAGYRPIGRSQDGRKTLLQKFTGRERHAIPKRETDRPLEAGSATALVSAPDHLPAVDHSGVHPGSVGGFDSGHDRRLDAPRLSLEEFVRLLPGAPQPLAQHHIELLRLCERIGPKRLVLNLPRGGRRC